MNTAKNISSSNVAVGDVVGLKTRRGTVIDCLVVSTRAIRCGRNAGRIEYGLTPMIRDGNTFGYTVKGDGLLVAPEHFWSEGERANARTEHHVTEAAETARKESKVERRVDAVADFGGIKAGDQVLVDYSNAPARWEKVAKPMNPKTGKIGIVVEGAKELNESMFSENLVAVYDSGMRRVKPKRRREVRWITPVAVKNVRRGKEA